MTSLKIKAMLTVISENKDENGISKSKLNFIKERECDDWRWSKNKKEVIVPNKCMASVFNLFVFVVSTDGEKFLQIHKVNKVTLPGNEDINNAKRDWWGKSYDKVCVLHLSKPLPPIPYINKKNIDNSNGPLYNKKGEKYSSTFTCQGSVPCTIDSLVLPKDFIEHERDLHPCEYEIDIKPRFRLRSETIMGEICDKLFGVMGIKVRPSWNMGFKNRRLELDRYYTIGNHRIALEYNGKQHYEWVEFFQKDKKDMNIRKKKT